MNIYQSHKHFIRDIIGLSVSASGGLAGIGVTLGNDSGLLLEGMSGLKADFGTGHYQIARGDHGHNNILLNAGDILITNTNGVYSISVSGALSPKILHPSSIAKFKSGNLGVIDGWNNNKIGLFNASQISSGKTRTYYLPDKDGTIMVEGEGSTYLINDRVPVGVPIILPWSDPPINDTFVTGNTTHTFIRWKFADDYVIPDKAFYFTIQYKRTGSFTWDAPVSILNASAREYEFVGLISGQEYQFRIMTHDYMGNGSSYSNVFTGIVALDTSKPDLPADLYINLLYGNSIHATWKENLEADFKEYKLYYNNDPDFEPDDSTLIYAGNVNNYWGQVKFTSTILYFKLAAFDFSGNKSEYQVRPLEISRCPDIPIISDVVTGSNLELDGTISLDISFIDGVDRTNTGFDIYIFRIRRKGDFSATFNFYDGTTTPYIRITNLIANTAYEITVAANNANGNSSFVSLADITTVKDIVPPNPPTSFIAKAFFNAIKLTWINPDAPDLDYIEIYRSQNGDINSAVRIQQLYGDTYSDTTLLQGTQYSYWLKAADTSGNVSAFSGIAQAIPIQLFPENLSTEAKVDFVLNNATFTFDEENSTLLTIKIIGSSGSIIRGSSTYYFVDSTVENADNSYIIATCVSGSNTVTFSVVDYSNATPALLLNQVIIALTSSQLSSTNRYQCYVRQANSMAIDGAILQDATITSAKIKTLEADKIFGGEISADVITSNSLSAANFNADRITSGTLQSGIITSDSISALKIDGGSIIAGTIKADSIASKTITADEIKAGTITGDIIAAGTITSDNIESNSITSRNISVASRTSGYREDFGSEFVNAWNATTIVTPYAINGSKYRPKITLQTGDGILGMTTIRMFING